MNDAALEALLISERQEGAKGFGEVEQR